MEAGLRAIFVRILIFAALESPALTRLCASLDFDRELAFLRFPSGAIDHMHRLAPSCGMGEANKARRPSLAESPLLDVSLVRILLGFTLSNVHVRWAVALAINWQRWKQSRAQPHPLGWPTHPSWGSWALGSKKNIALTWNTRWKKCALQVIRSSGERGVGGQRHRRAHRVLGRCR
ncbi:MAG: hypothetical protein N2515_03490 [Deltaproteobacteria bacterium]|nr:hypothetical protein [Deltaproteobacteria bacterium]